MQEVRLEVGLEGRLEVGLEGRPGIKADVEEIILLLGGIVSKTRPPN